MSVLVNGVLLTSGCIPDGMEAAVIGSVVVVVNISCNISGTASGGGASRGNTSGPIYYYGR